MSKIYDAGYKAGEDSCGKEKMNEFEGSQLNPEYMIGYCIARAEYEGAGSPMIYYSLGQHAGFYGLPKEEFKRRGQLKHDHDGLFDSGYEDAVDDRRNSYEDDDYDGD